MNLAKTFGVLSGLSGTYRFSNAKLVHRESVLEHLGAVTLTCFLIITEMEEIDDDLMTEGKDILSKAIVHDVEELLMGDIPRTTKYASDASRQAFRQMEVEALAQIVDNLELESPALMDYHKNAKREISGLIVKIADTLAVVYKVHEEAIERGNKAMRGRATTIEGQLLTCLEEVEAAKISSASKAFLINIINQARDIIEKAPISKTTIEENTHEAKGDHRRLRRQAK